MAFTKGEGLHIDMVVEDKNDSTSMLSVAREYAMDGLYVFPVYGIKDGRCMCGKRSCSSSGKHPNNRITANGLYDATIDIEMIRYWWEGYPESNIGIRTGKESGIIVVDVDGPAGEKALAEALGELPATWHGKTGKGDHYYFRYPGFTVGNRAGLLPQVDIRGDGGYVVAPPSRHSNGNTYEWVVPPTGLPAELPEGLVKLLIGPETERPRAAAGQIPEGQRNDWLYRRARSMKCGQWRLEAIEAALLAENEARCVPPLEIEEVQRIAQGAFTQGDRADFKSSDDTDSYRPPKSQDSNETNSPRLVLVIEDIGDLLDAGFPEIRWILEGYLAQGSFVTLAGYAKTGKTTFVNHLIAAIVKGEPFLGYPTQQGKILLLAFEEHKRDVVHRIRALAGEVARGQVKLITVTPPYQQDTINQLVAYVNREGISLVIIDTLPYWWNIRDENKAGEILDKGRLLVDAARATDACWLALAYTRKGGGSFGEDLRGSSALLGLVDVGISLKRTNENDTRRTLEAVTRYSETPDSLVISLKEGRYENEGGPVEAMQKKRCGNGTGNTDVGMGNRGRYYG